MRPFHESVVCPYLVSAVEITTPQKDYSRMKVCRRKTAITRTQKKILHKA